MKNLYLLIEIQGGTVESIVAYDKRSDANRKFRHRKKELGKTRDPNSYFIKGNPDAIAFYRVDSQLKTHQIDYFEGEMK